MGRRSVPYEREPIKTTRNARSGHAGSESTSLSLLCKGLTIVGQRRGTSSVQCQNTPIKQKRVGMEASGGDAKN